MKTYPSEQIKNVMLAGHGGSGKTSLAEALLYYNKAADRLGKVADGNTVMDFDPEEVKRQASVNLTAAFFEAEDRKINLLDAPGSFDFAGGMYEGVQAAGTVLIVLSGKSGVTPGAEIAYDLALQQGKSVAFFVSKLDSESADFNKCFAQLREMVGAALCPVVIPQVENHKVISYVNVLRNKAYTYDGTGVGKETAMPDNLPLLDDARQALNEAVAETDDALMEKYFAGEEFTGEELRTGINLGMAANKLIPVFCGSALTMDGVDQLTHYMAVYFPSAVHKANVVAERAGGEKVLIDCDPKQNLAAYVYKTVADPFIGQLSFIKVLRGTLTADSNPVDSRTGEPVRIGKILFMKGKKQIDTPQVIAGDLAALAKLGDVHTGDTLCAAEDVLSVPMAEFPNPTMSLAITAKNKGDEGKISGAIQRLTEEDMTLNYKVNNETHEQIITGLGDQHLDMVISKLKNKFGLEVETSTPIVPYRETIRKKVEVQGRHKKQTGGHGQFGDVWIRFEPYDGEDLLFAEEVFGGSVPKNFFPAVEKGLRDAVKHGVIAGYPVVGLKATLYDGSYHPVDSSEMSFKMAASLAYKNGLPQASPVLLEPIGLLKATLPDSCTGDLMSDINKRRGRILGMNPSGKMQEIEAEVPMSEMNDFTTVLRSMTQGRGRFTFEFVRYEQLPSNLEKDVIAAAPGRNVE